ncbi:MAG: knotted carbamoyltransferase YgeW [Tractidigestivibacter sp.]|jgi:knotted carbamoyltransferase YgeW|uniref:knotted carbamoyltransferase YgeW n=1 Tax=Tractidigestivibacter sp. TaxID=2847320 RepID=UPI003D8F4FEB
MDAKLQQLLDQLKNLDYSNMYNNDFLHTWDKTTDELKAMYLVADALRNLRERNISTRIFQSGLAVSNFRDNSTRTRFSFASGSNLLGLQLQDLDESKSQVAHGETVRETATMISFMADVIGIRDDKYIREGDAYMKEVSESVAQSYADGILDHRPTLVSLQSDSDHPTQSSADILYLINELGGVENLKGKKVAVTWAYSPSYGKPLSCPQSLITLLPRFGMDVTLAHPEGYDLMPELVEKAGNYAAETGATFKQTHSMEEAFEGADIVVPKSWASFASMERRTKLYAEGDKAGIDALEKEQLAENANHMDWHCTTELMNKTAHGMDTIYMHPLPADIEGVSCEHGEVENAVFDAHRDGLYKEASYKPYAVAAMIFLQKVKDPVAKLAELEEAGTKRWNF